MAWHKCGRRGVIEAVTGSGKTDVALTAIEDAVGRGLFALVIVPSRVLMEQWHDRLHRWMPDHQIGRLGDGYKDRPIDCDVLITTRHSAASRVPLPTSEEGGILIADECHGFGGAVLRKSLLPEYQERLGLTATLERSDDAVETILLPYFGGICYRYDFGSAIGDGVCAQPRVGFMAVPLTHDERSEYDATEGRIVSARRQLKQIKGVPHQPFGDFLAAVHHLAANDAGPNGRAANDYLNAFSSRREIVATSSAKYEALGRFAPAIKDADGALLFTETVRAANHAIVRLDPLISIEIITGDTGRRDRITILDGLRDGRLDAVAAPRVLDEGVDVPNANLGLVVSASRTRRQMIQRMGRILRRKPLGSGARFVIIFAADTLEDPRFSEDRDGFLEEIEEIAEASRIFSPNEFDQLADFLDYSGPSVLIEPVVVGTFEAPDLAPEEITEWTPEEQPYLELRSPALPDIGKPKVVREKPRLSTGEHPVSLEAIGKQWALKCTGCGVTSEPTTYKWQAMDGKVTCECVR
jgi:superfamily II DNA or RNA helicase